jgi:hypothetical protein
MAKAFWIAACRSVRDPEALADRDLRIVAGAA